MNHIAALSDHVARLAKQDDEAGASALLRQAADVDAIDFALGRRLAVQARAIDRNDLAVSILNRVPATIEQQLMVAQLRQEMGEPVAATVGHVLEGRIGANQQTLQLIGAMSAEGDSDGAVALLDSILAREAGWIAGQQVAAHLKWQAGDSAALEGFARAADKRPSDEMLWAAWLGTLVSAEDWETYSTVDAKAASVFPDSVILMMIRFDALSSMGDAGRADMQLVSLQAISDPNFDAAKVRHLMRHRRFREAASMAEAAVAAHGSPECWAWLGAAWRTISDARADWFYRGSDLLHVVELGIDDEELGALAGLLRRIHQGTMPPLGQSPRGGTQTQGPLLKRREPEIVGLRARLKRAIKDYVTGLPAADSGHPFLSRPRGATRFEGAWSIKLRPNGHHVPHIHSHGWISSALYVDLPPSMGEDKEQRGWFEMGVPLLPSPSPVEAIRTIAPIRGRLALFPSLFWHGTRPFDDGERLTVAFDVVPA